MNANDNINMEYEARVMINEEQYLNVKNYYLSRYKNAEIITNENTYFDTKDLYLTEHQMVLRLRKINDDKHELTLKIQEENGCLEINHDLTLIELDKLLNDNEICGDEIIAKLSEVGVNLKDIKLITTLRTDRIEIPFDKYLLVIDKNYYNDKVDFNLEVESSSKNYAENYLFLIISQFHIEYKKDYISKSRRAIYNL